MLNRIRELQARLLVAAVDESGMSTVEYANVVDCTQQDSHQSWQWLALKLPPTFETDPRSPDGRPDLELCTPRT